MIRKGRLGTLLWTALVALPIATGASRAAAETWHAETLSSSPRGIHVTQYWASGNDKLRAETVVAGHRLVTIVNGDRYYAIDVTTGQAMAIERPRRAREADRKFPRLVGTEGMVLRNRGGEKVKTERLAGQVCDVWRMTDGRGRREVWVQQSDDGAMLPLRVLVYSRKAAAEIRTDYTQWASGLDLPERLFQPDPRFSLIELGYDEYVKRSATEGTKLPPVLHANLLHGERE